MATQTQNTEKITTVCFTGHREIEKDKLGALTVTLKQALRILISHGAERFLAGGALGFDTVAALAVLELKKEYPHIKLELILPCKNQTKMWNEKNRVLYGDILSQADHAEYLHETYTSTCMHDRNRRLVDESDLCVAYLEHSGGGTAYTFAYALKSGKEVLNLAELI